MYAKFFLYIWERFCVGYAKLLLYIWEGFCVGVRKTLPVYSGVLLGVGVCNFNIVTPIYMGEVLRRGTQYLSYIYRSENLIIVMLSIAVVDSIHMI